MNLFKKRILFQRNQAEITCHRVKLHWVIFLMNLFSVKSHWTYKASIMNILTDMVNMVKILPLHKTNMPTQNYSTRALTDHLYILFQMERQNVFSIKQSVSLHFKLILKTSTWGNRKTSTTLCKRLSLLNCSLWILNMNFFLQILNIRGFALNNPTFFQVFFSHLCRQSCNIFSYKYDKAGFCI